MLDNFICCDKFFKLVNDSKTTTPGVQSDHSAIHVKFKLTEIKLNLKRDALTIIDWEKFAQIPKPTLNLIQDYTSS